MLGAIWGSFAHKQIARFDYWAGMWTDIKEYMAASNVCILSLAGLLQPLWVPHKSWANIRGKKRFYYSGG